MEFLELINLIEIKLLAYVPLQEIYDVEKHQTELGSLYYEDVSLLEMVENNWDRICLNLFKVLKELSEYIDKDDYLNNAESEINSYIFELKEILNKKNIIDLYKVQKEKIVKTTLLLNLYACCVVPQGKSDYVMNENWRYNKSNVNTLFRGEEDYNYSLIASIYRNEDFGINGQTLNISSFLFPYYKKSKLIEKYEAFNNFSFIDYDFCSLMQHSGCKSPFLDISYDPSVSLSFASYFKQDVDGALYVFSNIKKIDEEEMDKLSVFAINRRLDLLTLVRKTPILLCGLDKFEIELEVLTKQTNDRMKFQKGAFLYINKCIIVNNRILLPISNKNIKKIPYSCG